MRIKSQILHMICATVVLAFTALTPALAEEKNPVLDDPAVVDALMGLDPKFGDLAVRMAGEVWGRGHLTNKERAFISIGADVCNQTLNGPFQFHVEMALQNGATRADVREAMLHMVIYGAFPKVLEATAAMNALYAQFDAAGKYQTGDAYSVSAPAENFVLAPEVADALLGFDPAFGDLAVRMAGEVWGRPGLTQKERALISLGADVCNQTLAGPLQFHIDMALKGGASKDAVQEAILHMVIYGAFPKVLQATAAMNEHFAALEAN